MDVELIKTGDFAKMCAVTKKALYVNEAKGLLQPAVVKDMATATTGWNRWTKLRRSAC